MVWVDVVVVRVTVVVVPVTEVLLVLTELLETELVLLDDVCDVVVELEVMLELDAVELVVLELIVVVGRDARDIGNQTRVITQMLLGIYSNDSWGVKDVLKNFITTGILWRG